MDAAVRGGPPRRTRRSGARCAGADRAKYLYRIARIIQERARELAVLESIDNGKPIRESRDVDIPLVAAHFFYYAGWADKLEHAGFGPRPAPDRRGRPGHPVELPAAHAGLEDRPGAGRRQHGRAQAGRDDPADRAGLRRDLPAGRPAARRRQHHHRRRRDRAAAGRAPGRGQGRLHRVDRGRSGDRQVGRRHAASGSPSSWAARRRTSSSTTPRSTRRSRASSTASSSTRATSAAPARACWSRSRSPRHVLDAAQAADGDAARRRPAGQEHRHRRDQLRRPAGAHPRALRGGRVRGGRPLVAAVRAARRAASGSRRPSSPASPRRTGSPARRSSARCCRC